MQHADTGNEANQIFRKNLTMTMGASNITSFQRKNNVMSILLYSTWLARMLCAFQLSCVLLNKFLSRLSMSFYMFRASVQLKEMMQQHEKNFFTTYCKICLSEM